MQIQTVIDDNLFVLASRVAGVADARLLLEHALRLLIQTKTEEKNAAAGRCCRQFCHSSFTLPQHGISQSFYRY
ncbi:hypothetical protein [Candidatus Electronema sp. JM]|uniref:hypothetical protein n=1 Tax=Candidatus Electronema sp. JM TaxID=3401571 RepID=UPI003AA9AF25